MRELCMANRFTGVFEQVGEWWLGYVEDLPGANTQGRTLEEVRALQAHAPSFRRDLDLVAVCGYSRSTLFQAFKSDRGYTPMQFLASRRLDLARGRLMREPDATVTEIALECGFSNHGRFAKAYRSRFGESPSATRTTHHGLMHHRSR